MSHSRPHHPHSVGSITSLWPFDPDGTRIPAIFASERAVDRLLPMNQPSVLELRRRLLRHAGSTESPDSNKHVARALVGLLAQPQARETFHWTDEYGDGLEGLTQWLFNIAHQRNPLFEAQTRNGQPPRFADFHQSRMSTREALVDRIRQNGRQSHGDLAFRDCLRLLAWTIHAKGDSDMFLIVANHATHWLPFLMEGLTLPIAVSSYLDLEDHKNAERCRAMASLREQLRHEQDALENIKTS